MLMTPRGACVCITFLLSCASCSASGGFEVTEEVDMLQQRTDYGNDADDAEVTHEVSLLQTVMHMSTEVAAKPHFLQNFTSPSMLDQCVVAYADGLDQIQPGLGDNIRAHPKTAVATSGKHLILSPGEGTTGTRSMAVALKQLVDHFGTEFKEIGNNTAHWGSLELMGVEGDQCPLIQHMDAAEKAGAGCHDMLHNIDFTRVPEDIGVLVGGAIFTTFIDWFLAFPNAKVILTIRPRDEWAASRLKRNAHLPIQEPCGAEFDKDNLEEMGKIFEVTNAFIKCVVPPEQFLEIDMFSRPTDTIMRRLREFLGFPEDAVMDNAEFPHISDLRLGQCGILFSDGLDTSNAR